VPTGKRPSGGVTILDLEQDPIAFFPNPIDVVQFYIPRMALEEFCYENRIAMANTLTWPHCDGHNAQTSWYGRSLHNSAQ